MILFRYKSKDGRTHSCNGHCYNGFGHLCKCLCRGTNHGVGLQKAIENTQAHIDEWRKEADIYWTHPDLEFTQLPLFIFEEIATMRRERKKEPETTHRAMSPIFAQATLFKKIPGYRGSSFM